MTSTRERVLRRRRTPRSDDLKNAGTGKLVPAFFTFFRKIANFLRSFAFFRAERSELPPPASRGAFFVFFRVFSPFSGKFFAKFFVGARLILAEAIISVKIERKTSRRSIFAAAFLGERLGDVRSSTFRRSGLRGLDKMRGLRVWAKRAKQAKREKRAKLAKRRTQLAILTAALGFASWSVWGGANVGNIGGVGNVGAVATARETSGTNRQIVPEPKDGKLESPTGLKAFIVGADDYRDATDLPCVRNDVEAFAARLIEVGFEEKNVAVLKTGGKFDDFPT